MLQQFSASERLATEAIEEREARLQHDREHAMAAINCFDSIQFESRHQLDGYMVLVNSL